MNIIEPYGHRSKTAPPHNNPSLGDELEAWEAASDEALEIFDKEFPPLEI